MRAHGVAMRSNLILFVLVLVLVLENQNFIEDEGRGRRRSPYFKYSMVIRQFRLVRVRGPMKELSSTQAKYLRGIAHSLKPVVFLGQKGLTDALISSTEEAFDRHELIKIKFIDFKEKKQKTKMAESLEIRTGSHLAGIIGHIAILYRPHPDPEKRKIILPK